MNITSEFIVTILAGIIVAAVQYYFFESKLKNIEYVPLSVIHTTSEIVDRPQSEVKCANCSWINRSKINYCTKCGSPLFEECPFCYISKPLAESICGNCGKNPQELRILKINMAQLSNKAYLLGIAYLVVFIRTFSLSQEPSWIDALSVIIVIPGIFGLGLEANHELKWLYSSRLWHSRKKWLPQTAKDIERSFWIFASITFSVALSSIVLIVKVFGWIT